MRGRRSLGRHHRLRCSRTSRSAQRAGHTAAGACRADPGRRVDLRRVRETCRRRRCRPSSCSRQLVSSSSRRSSNCSTSSRPRFELASGSSSGPELGVRLYRLVRLYRVYRTTALASRASRGLEHCRGAAASCAPLLLRDCTLSATTALLRYGSPVQALLFSLRKISIYVGRISPLPRSACVAAGVVRPLRYLSLFSPA